MKATTIAVAAMFVAIIVGVGWALAMVPNVEFITAVAFTAGACLGILKGTFIGIIGIFIFSATNPVGSGLAFPLLLLAQMVSLGLIGAAGGLIAKLPDKRLATRSSRVVLAAAGLLLTIIYDGLTSITFPLFAGAPLSEIAAVLISGLVFTAIHQVSNTIIFFSLVPRLIAVSRRALSKRADLASTGAENGL
ncbi:MAG: hypothetical protein KAU50_12950 [Candidatus Marinimicrobia bacterium]|nr:hypothetical protein [Candidatus Neomarinimicrobiota bacterium]